MENNHDSKKIAGESAVNLVKNGMVVGIGTGSTVYWTIKKLGNLVKNGLEILGVPTSYQTEILAIECEIPLTTLAEHPDLDIAIDGADQVDSNLNAIKGGGAAHTREKVVACSAKKLVLVVTKEKVVPKLNHFVPLEVLPYARPLVEKQIKKLGGNPILRLGKSKYGPVITDNGNFIIDAHFGIIKEVKKLDNALSKCVGIVEHGIFTNADEVHIGSKDGVEIIRR